MSAQHLAASKSLGKMMKNDQKSHFLLAFKDDWADCFIFQ
jgi:hypothetical protein